MREEIIFFSRQKTAVVNLRGTHANTALLLTQICSTSGQERRQKAAEKAPGTSGYRKRLWHPTAVTRCTCWLGQVEASPPWDTANQGPVLLPVFTGLKGLSQGGILRIIQIFRFFCLKNTFTVYRNNTSIFKYASNMGALCKPKDAILKISILMPSFRPKAFTFIATDVFVFATVCKDSAKLEQKLVFKSVVKNVDSGVSRSGSPVFSSESNYLSNIWLVIH